ncbi:tandem-95 repeat protein [Luteolibacter ambystomatis]|uniref:Tandem-95 repeat protein n=1 Tax=Luteolibacter ambystomatis TaxID=2824561 RepID=A0A975J256_9BACT|nr:putative Ig domain-containing protein [Luteolibacter ambystomatis]QUE52655.1 tandem-95 repeat protein [Luteolibacter ambystomatis]
MEAVHPAPGQPGSPQAPATDAGDAAAAANAPAANGQGDFGTWAYEKPREPDFAKLDAFDGWMAQWKNATPEERKALAKEGARLAGDRRPEYRALISFDPRQAVDRAVTRVQRQDLPAEITSQLETPVSAVGAYNVLMGRPAPGLEVPGEALTMRSFVTGGVSYKAHVPAELQSVLSIPSTPLQGYADGGDFAVASNAVRPLDVGEKIPAGTTVQTTCPVSGKTTESVSAGETVTQDTPTVQIGETIISLCEGGHVAVLQDDYRTYAQASGSGGGGFFMDNFPGTASRSIGAFKCLYIRVLYQDQTSAPNTEESAYNDMRNNARYYIEASYGKMTQTTTFSPLVTLPHTQKWYIDKENDGYQVGLNLVHSDSRAAAKALGYDSSQFDCTIVRVNGGPLLSGSSWGGGSSVWVTWDGMDVLNHECGHSLGLNHANYWNTSDGTAYGTGASQNYGNGYDVMGGAYGFSGHYNTISKRRLSWIQPNYYHAPKGNGLYRIYAYDQPQLEEGKRYAINVPKDSIRSYNIEYHPARGGLLADQALVIYDGMGGTNAGHLLDTTPGTPGGKGDAGIGEGRTYSDWESDQHFTVVAKNATTPVSLDVVYNRGPFPGNVAPTATLGASATTISTGGSVTFTATASDANGDPLAYYWQFDDGTYGTNNAVFTRTFNTAAQVNAMLTVSDMKGGTVRRSVVINVGSHGKQQITGTVTDGTNPLAGVMIGNGSKYAFTNADGTYSLPGLSTGSTTLTASLPGYTFTPSTANPYTVVAGTNTVNWTSAVPTLVTLTKTADPTEGGSNGNFRLTRAGDTSADLVVLVSPVGGTATMTTDYTFTPAYVASGSYKSFTIPAGSATLDVVVAAVNDTAAEGPETITLQLASSAGYVSGSSNSVVMTVNDNDTTLPLVAVTAPDPYATEAPSSTDTGKFTFTRTGSTAAALNLTVAWSGAATNGTDYTTLPTTVTIPVGQSSVDVIVSPTDDSAIEVPEDVVATISTNAAYLRDAGATTASVIITDDDTPVVTVSVPDPNASESGPDTGTFLVTRTGSTAAPLTVYYGLTGTASYGTDYAALTGQVTIAAGATSAPVVITPYDDDISEPAETVVLSLSTFNNAYSIGSAYQGTVTLTDNNDPVLVTVRAGSIGTEGGSNATLIFHTIGTGNGNLTVNYTVGGTATAGSDYTALSGTVSVPVNGSNDTTVIIPVLNDTTVEPTETVVVTITPGTGYKVYNDPSATALIRDNDSGGERVVVSTTNQTPSEAGPTAANFYFSRAVGTTGDLTVNYTVSGTATNGTDYANLSGTVVIPDGAAVATVAVTSVDDALVEGSETVTVTVVAGTGYSPDFPASATYQITDNDVAPVTVGFQQAAIALSEQPGALGEYRDLPVVLSAASASTVTVNCISSGGSAMGDDVDWAFVDAANGNAVIPYATLTFPPGTTTKNLRIRVKNDGYIEGMETAVLQLINPVNASFTTGRITESLAIFDDVISGLVTEERWNNTAVYTNNTWNTVNADYTGFLTSFTPAQDVADNYSRRLVGAITAPTTGTYNFWIASDDASRLYLSTDATAANKVQIATVSGYTAFQNWDANASQKSANITLTAGQTYYMEVQHQEGGGGDHVSVAWQGPGFTRTPISYLPTDTAPRTVRMLSASSTRLETDGSEPMLQVLLDRPAGSTPITVNYTSTGTATNGSDYSLANGTLTFNSGEQMKSLPLSLLTDAIGEAPEGIVVSLSSPSGASLTAPSSMTVTLLDASAPVVATNQVNATSAMSVGTVLGTATATPASGRTITGWAIVAGDEGGLFAINASGQVTLVTPGSLPNPGVRHLVVRAIDSAGATGDGSFKVVCNPPAVAGVSEKRFAGATAYNTNTWTGTTNYTGSLATFTTPQDVADSYSRQLTGYIQVPTTGDYTFWIASDDASRLYLSTDETAANKSQIATVSGYTGFQSWDSQSSQKSATFTLTAGKVYYMEVQHNEGGGGDHASVAWQGPGISRAAIPATAIFPQFLAPAVPPCINVGAPVAGSNLTSGSNVTVSANVVATDLAVTSVEFYVDGSLIGSDSSAPHSITWTNNVTVGSHNFTAKAIYSGGTVTSVTSSFTVPNAAPTFTANPINGSNATEDAAYSGSIASYGSDINPGDTLTYSKVSGPSWLSVASNGALSGTPLDGDVGANAFTVKVTDAAGANATTALNITVTNTNDAPAFTANPITGAGATEDSAYSGSIASYGADVDVGDTITYSKVSGPSWLVVASNGALSGTPLNGDVGANAFTVKVTDVAGADATTTLNITVANTNDAPTFTANPITGAGAAEDSAYSGSLASYGADVDVGDTITYSKVSGPSWLSVASNGALSGTPLNANVGANAFTVKVTDAAGANSTATLNITVTNTNDAPTFTANPITGAGATEDSAYSGSIASYGADVDVGDSLTYSKVSGPSWLVVASNGALSGTPLNADVGANAFTVKVTDAAGANATTTLNITVANTNDAPTFTANPITGAGATEDSAYSGSIASYGADVDVGDTITYSKVSGPSWLVVASNGALSGTPDNSNVGANAFTVKVTDAAGANATTTLNITVANTNDAPTFTANPITGAGAAEDSAYSDSIASYGEDVDVDDTLTYSKVSGPAWLVVTSDGALSGTPLNGDVGTNVFTVKVTDAAGANATTALNITVANTNDAPTFATTLTAADATSGMPYTGSSISGSASDVDAGDTLTYSKVSGPSWLVIASNGTLSGTPGLADGGSANVFTVRATDGAGAYAETTLTINVIIPDLAADPDGDGSPTGLEFTVGTAPFDVASVPGSIYTNLRGWWKLDETSGTNADDATGRVQDGTIAGSPASTTGIVGNALNLDGTDDGITLGAAPSLSGTGDFTVGAWVKIAPGSGTGVIIQQRDATGSGYNGEYGLQVLSNGTVEFYIYNNGYQFDIVTPATYGLVNDNQWHHVAATRSGTTGTVYVDGNPLATASGTAKSLVSTITMSIGWDQRDNNRRFKGLLDEVRLYTRALSASELNGLHDGLIANRAPAFTASSFTMGNATVGSAYSGSLVGRATDADTDVLTFAKVSGPSWLTIASNGALSGTPAAGDAGTGSYSVSVTDPDGQSATATMNITVYGALPSGWTAGDIGSTGVAGSSGYTSGTGLYTISGAGADIWGTADAFQYASTAMTGDGEIRARVTSQTNTAGWAKAGVMMRDTTAAGSAHAMMVVTPSNGFANQYRATTGASSTHIAGPALNAYPNNWVRVTRCGSLFTTYVSSNGTTWTQVGQETVTMGTTIRVGLAVDASSTTTASTATFDNVTVTPYPSPWVTGDIGTTGVAGRSEFFNNVHTLNGAGVVGGTADGFRYTYQALTADGDITVRIPTFANTGTSSRIGVMIRDTLAVDARHVFLGTDGSGAFTWTRRTATAGSTTTSNSGTATAPNVWVRLIRVGNDITAYSSTNGTSWTNVGTVTVTMAGNCYIGLAVGSGNTTGLNASTFDNLTVTP